MFTHRKMRPWGLMLLACVLAQSVAAQQWPGYTLYSTSNSSTVLLVDTNGTTYHTWSLSGASTGYSTYMEPGGTIVRSVRTNNPAFQGGGLTGRIQKVDWNGTVTWDWVHSGSTYILHHDHHVMPNGNVLVISYENKTPAEVTAAGCLSSLTVQSEKIMEVEPTGPTTGNIVWEWHLWDHLVQNVDSTKANYHSSISAHPELMNINYAIQKDWSHMNGLDYNAETDQIIFSSHNFDEIYVIDHSTTTAEAATHSGGNSGKGGDFLYRWGNPAAYQAGNTSNQILKVVHDSHWIPKGSPNEGWLVGFNNDGISQNQSAVDYVDAPENGYGFDLGTGPAFGPATYTARTACNGRTTNMGNSEQFPNGNTLICMATLGTIYEIDPGGNLLWTKQVTGMVPQAHRYTECYINGNAEPDALATASQDTVCPNEAVDLSVTPSGGTTYTYQWSSYPYGFSSTDSNPTVNPAQTTTYFVTVTSGGCFTTRSVKVVVTFAPWPIISGGNDTLFSTPAVTYQWYVNGTLIPGATGAYHLPTQSGLYTVMTTDSAGCSSEMSAQFPVTIVGLSGHMDQGWQLFPNPTTGLLNIQAPNADGFVVSVMDACGKRVAVGLNTSRLDLGDLQAGIYFVQIMQADRLVATRKIALTH